MTGRVLIAALALLAFAGCDMERAPAAADPNRLAQDVLAWHGHAPAVKVALLVRVKPATGDALTFSVNGWSPDDGRVRVNLAKLGFDGMDALIAADGELNLVLPRSDETFHGWLHEFLPPDARVDRANLARMIDELKHGPLSPAETYAGNGRTLRYRDPATGFEAVVELDPRLPQVTKKTLLNDQGRELAVWTYSQYAQVEGVNRPMRMKLAFPGRGGEATMRVETFDVVPSVSADRMTLRQPDSARALSFDEFLRRLGG